MTCARSRQRCQASVAAGRRVQSGADSAIHHQGRNTEGSGRPENQATFRSLAGSGCLPAVFRPHYQLRLCVLADFVGEDLPAPKIAIQCDKIQPLPKLGVLTRAVSSLCLKTLSYKIVWA